MGDSLVAAFLPQAGFVTVGPCVAATRCQWLGLQLPRAAV